MEQFGIDISAWQRGFDLKKAVETDHITYAIIKFGGADSNKYKDSQCENFYAQAKAIGLPVGAYYFGKCTNEAGALIEAKHFLSLISGKTFPCKVWYDIEASMQTLPSATLNAIAKTFCKYLKDNGYDCGVYANASTFKKIDFDGSFSASYPKWVAYWGKSKPTTVIDGRDMWQFGGETNLIRSNKIQNRTIDMDYCYFDFGKVTPVVPTPTPTPTPTSNVALPTLKLGSIGDNARLLQKNLNHFGYGLKEDSCIGERTIAALKGWQLAVGLVSDGVYGNNSYNKMKTFFA